MKEQTLQISPDYIVGFVDGEGCFCASISKHKTLKRRREVRLFFEIELREDDREILEAIRDHLGCGKIYYLDYERYAQWKPHVKLKISKNGDLVNRIIPFFDAHPLIAKKRHSYKLFREIAFMMKRKEHLTDAGFERISLLKQQMNE